MWIKSCIVAIESFTEILFFTIDILYYPWQSLISFIHTIVSDPIILPLVSFDHLKQFAPMACLNSRWYSKRADQHYPITQPRDRTIVCCLDLFNFDQFWSILINFAVLCIFGIIIGGSNYSHMHSCCKRESIHTIHFRPNWMFDKWRAKCALLVEIKMQWG